MATVFLFTTGCVPGDGASTVDDPSGFFSGIWHGWVAPLTLIWGFLDPAVRVYEPANTGWWYDFGYYMAVISPFGGLSLTRRRKSHRNAPSTMLPSP